ncbi:GPW/gp25 family protein [Citrobacter portucalensis]|uniref:GPW/gp25 family protein n=1 Tax=Citrobacter portucalensis TaxID=1639133 RepID=UPI002B4A9679|nr:GPW/gp25 family protein [Citrobacter portucalensis]
MMRYVGMNQQNGIAISEAEHLRQSVQDILLTPIGSRLARREYGSLLPALIDSAQNPAGRLRVMSAIYGALCRWEPRIQLDSISLENDFSGRLMATLTGIVTETGRASLSVSLTPGGRDARR